MFGSIRVSNSIKSSGTAVSLSPGRRAWLRFKRNRLGYWSLLAFVTLVLLSLLAEVISNDRPLLVRYQGTTYFPIVKDYSEKTFGGDFDTATDYLDPFIRARLSQEGNWALFAPNPYGSKTLNYFAKEPNPSAPGRDNWLGTDDGGRDVVARLIYGFRISVLFGLTLTIISSVIGVAAGAVQGYFGGWVDLLFQRFIEIWTSIPSLYLLLIISSVLAPGFFVLLGILLLFSWVSLVGLVRAEFLRGRNFEYIMAARALGVSNAVIIFRHLLPNAMVATMTFLPFILSSSVMTLTALDFLGFGLPPGSPSLGEMLSQAKANVTAPWLGLTGFFSIAIMLSLLIFIGEAVRDAFDPRKTFR